MKCLLNSRRIVANKNKQVFFTWQLENKLLRAFVLWMNDILIHKNMNMMVGWCNFWGFLTETTGDRYEELAAMGRKRSRYDPVMICMNFNSSASMVIFFIIPVFFLFCFWTRNFIHYTSVSCVWFLLPWVTLLNLTERKNLPKLGLFISFSLWGFSSLLKL